MRRRQETFWQRAGAPRVLVLADRANDREGLSGSWVRGRAEPVMVSHRWVSVRRKDLSPTTTGNLVLPPPSEPGTTLPPDRHPVLPLPSAR